MTVPTDVYPTRFVVGRVPNGHAGHEACERTDREISGEAKNRNLSAICLFLFFFVCDLSGPSRIISGKTDNAEDEETFTSDPASFRLP